jgi:acetyl-CoA carboxylase biotin carboxyl carrier protein
MNIDEIKRLLQLMDENKLVEFEYEDEGRRLKLRRAEDRVVQQVPIAVPAAVPLAVPAPAAVPAVEAARPTNVVEFKSPLVGTFYRSPKPDADVFCNVGDEVGAEKVICIIEAMKVMNEIKAELQGVIREILVKNGQAVEYGEPLFLIEKK